MTEVEGFTSDEQVNELVAAKKLLEQYAKGLPTLEEFRLAAASVASDYLLGILAGRYGDPRTPKEAAEVAHKVLGLVSLREIGSLGDEIAKVESAADRQALFAEFKQKALEAQTKDKK